VRNFAQMAANILVVDDNPDLGLTLKMALELEGFQVELATTGGQALALQRQKPAAVVITDIFMPDTDGFELIATIKREFPATRIVVMSGGGQRLKRDYLTSAELIGVDATLQKPFDIVDLIKVLKAF
jgi:DNA-binding response OmpR family regulator